MSRALCALSINPFPDVRGTIPQFDAPAFAERQKVHGVTVDEAHFRKVDREGPAFLVNDGTKEKNVVLRDPSADAQHHDVALSRKSVDSASHGALTDRDSKRLSTRRLVKSRRMRGRGDWSASRIS
jgi:hypothetical protein